MEQMNSEYIHHAIAFPESYKIVDKNDESLFALQREIIKVMFEHEKNVNRDFHKKFCCCVFDPKGLEFFVLPLMCIVQNDNLVEKCQNSYVEMKPSSCGRSRTMGWLCIFKLRVIYVLLKTFSNP